MRGIARFSEFFGLRRSTVGMLCMVILVGMGERMAERFLPIYLMALGGGALSIGALSGLDNLLSALYSFPGGYLSDRLGTKRALLVFNIMAMCGFLLVILIPAWQAVLVGAVFFLSWTAISLPATMNEQTHHGGFDALFCTTHPYGPWTDSGRTLHRYLGRT
jgi:MFS family permease